MSTCGAKTTGGGRCQHPTGPAGKCAAGHAAAARTTVGQPSAAGAAGAVAAADPLDTSASDKTGDSVDLATLSDDDLRDHTEQAILSSAVMNGTRWADQYHEKVDAAYDECKTRGRGIYQHAFNRAVRSQGHDSMVTQPKPGDP